MTTNKIITYRELMTQANKDASELLRENRKFIKDVAEKQAWYDSKGIKAIVVAPKVLTWADCLSRAMKRLYKLHVVVAELTEEMKAHNALIFEWEVKQEERGRKLEIEMKRWEMQGLQSNWKNYTGD